MPSRRLTLPQGEHRPRGLQNTRIFYGWLIVGAAGVIVAVGSGSYFYGLGAFFVPLTHEFGWSRTLTSTAYSLDKVLVCVFSALAGFAFDRLGPRRMMTAGVALLGGGFALLGSVQSFPMLLVAVACMSAGFSLGFALIATATVANWFVRRRTLAIGILMAGGGLGGVLVPLIAAAIESQGWRTAALMVAIGLWVIGLPLAQVIRHRPEEMGLRTDGDEPDRTPIRSTRTTSAMATGSVASDPTSTDLNVPDALRTRTFWLLAVAGSLVGVAQTALNVHIIPHLSGIGIPTSIAASTVAAVTLVSVAGRLGFGWLGDRVQKRYVLALTLTLQFLGLVVFANIAGTWQLALFIALYAPGYGGALPVRPSLQGEYFGRRYFGAIQGVIVLGGALGNLIGPVFAGWMFDTLGDYRQAFWIMALIAASAVPATLAIPTPPRRAGATKDPRTP